jgi:hypothetical protein
MAKLMGEGKARSAWILVTFKIRVFGAGDVEKDERSAALISCVSKKNRRGAVENCR